MNIDELRTLSDPGDDRKVIICLPWGERYVRSVPVNCAVCDQPLAMSKPVREENPDALAACAKCAHEASPNAMPGVTPAVRRQVAARFGIDPGAQPGISLKDYIRRTQP